LALVRLLAAALQPQRLGAAHAGPDRRHALQAGVVALSAVVAVGAVAGRGARRRAEVAVVVAQAARPLDAAVAVDLARVAQLRRDLATVERTQLEEAGRARVDHALGRRQLGVARR